MAPADAVLYALRDATATVDSVPLICGSILSKKLAEGISGLVLDVKCGAGAVFSEFNDAKALGQALVDSAACSGLPAVALVTDMDSPLGMTVGHAIEVAEAIDCLGGNGPDDLRMHRAELRAATIAQKRHGCALAAHPHDMRALPPFLAPWGVS